MARIVDLVARGMAGAGGLVLVALVLVTCLSVLGRGLATLAWSDWLGAAAPGAASALASLGLGPVKGDFELVESGIAFAIFAFLPWCQLRSGHATVDLFTARLPPRAGLWLTAFWEVVFAAVLVFIAWRLEDGMQGKIRNGETTFLLQFPVWWAYAASLAAASVAALVGLYVALARVTTAASGRVILPQDDPGGGR
ncbi:MAG: TRAP transporter small permease [Paracoccaceae bacterium]|nr:MAG: TRAP transporter small permease [Paracoccaceae bacterium]